MGHCLIVVTCPAALAERWFLNLRGIDLVESRSNKHVKQIHNNTLGAIILKTIELCTFQISTATDKSEEGHK